MIYDSPVGKINEVDFLAMGTKNFRSLLLSLFIESGFFKTDEIGGAEFEPPAKIGDQETEQDKDQGGAETDAAPEPPLEDIRLLMKIKILEAIKDLTGDELVDASTDKIIALENSVDEIMAAISG